MQCSQLALKDPQGNPCEREAGPSIVAQRRAAIPAAAGRVGSAIDTIRARAPKARVVYVSYLPALPAAGPCTTMPLANGDIPFLHRIQRELNDAFVTAARAHGATVVDASQIRGRDMCAPAGVRWTEPLLPGTPVQPLHPNAAGQAMIAGLIRDALATR